MSLTALFTYASLGTFAGAAAATTLLVEAAKRLPGVRRLPPRLLALVIAMVLLVVPRIVSRSLVWSGAPLLLLNGLLVAFSAIGVWHIATSVNSSGKGG